MRSICFTLVFLVINGCSLPAQTLAEEKFEMDGITDVELRGAFCNVSVEGYEGATLYFEGVIEGPSRGKYSIEYDRTGSLLKVWVDSRGNGGNVRGAFKLKLPAKTNLDIDNSSGNVVATNLTGKSTRLKASSGNVDARNIQSELYLKTSSGDIDLEGLQGNLRAASSSGGQDLSRITGDLQSRSSSGRIALDKVTGNVTAETSSGGISINEIKGRLELESTSGSIRGNDVELTADAYFKSSSGSIGIGLVNDLQSLNFDLSAGSGSLKVGSRRAEGRLIDRRTDGFEIRGISSSGSQRYDN